MNFETLRSSSQIGAQALDEKTTLEYLSALSGWYTDGQRLEKTVHFKDYYQTIDFVNALAAIAHQEDHHPDLGVHYNRVVVVFSTHDADGLTLNDFICAAKCDALLSTEPFAVE